VLLNPFGELRSVCQHGGKQEKIGVRRALECVQQAQHCIEAALATSLGTEEMTFVEHEKPNFFDRICGVAQ
jgi:hypothetical protein